MMVDAISAQTLVAYIDPAPFSFALATFRRNSFAIMLIPASPPLFIDDAASALPLKLR